MIRINLLPVKQIKSRLKAQGEVIFLAISLLVLGAGIGLVALVQQHRIDTLQTIVKNLTAERNSYQATINLIKKLKVDKVNLEAKLTAIKELQQGSQLPVRVLNALADLTPADRIWLKKLTYGGSNLQLAGVALDNASIAEFMNLLGGSEYFGKPALGKSSQARIGGQQLKTFSLRCQVLNPAAMEASPKQEQRKKG